MKVYTLKGLNIYTEKINKENVRFILDNSYYLKISKKIYIYILRVFVNVYIPKFLIKTVKINRVLKDKVKNSIEDRLNNNLIFKYYIPKTSFRNQRGAYIFSNESNILYFTKFNYKENSYVESLNKEFKNLVSLKKDSVIHFPDPILYDVVEDVEILVTRFLDGLKVIRPKKEFFVKFKNFSLKNSITHYDLTPWNVFELDKKYVILDWGNASKYYEDFDEIYYYTFLSFYKKLYLFKLNQINKKLILKKVKIYLEELVENRKHVDNTELKKIITHINKLLIS